jgi:hypothetical protein
MTNPMHTEIGLGPYRLVLPAWNQKIAMMPPDDETWDLIIQTIQLARQFSRKESIWTDGTWIP